MLYTLDRAAAIAAATTPERMERLMRVYHDANKVKAARNLRPVLSLIQGSFDANSS